MKKIILAFSIFLLCSLIGFAQCGGNQYISQGGSFFEQFQTDDVSGSNACISVTSNYGGDCTGSWSKIGNALIRESKRPSNTNTNMSYYINISASGNVYHGGYGWWSYNGGGTQSIAEFYVVEGYNTKSNATYGMRNLKRDYWVDGSWYEIWVAWKRNKGTVWGDRNFRQIKCVRKSQKGMGLETGQISWPRHFQAMAEAGYSPQTIFEISYVVEGFGYGNTSNTSFYLNASFYGAKSLDDVNTTPGAITSVSPNPTSGEFFVKTNGVVQNTVTIYDLNGRMLSESIVDGPVSSFNSDSSLLSGIYIVKVSNSENTDTHKLVIQ